MFMEDEQSELKRRLRPGLGVVAGMFIAECVGQYIRHQHAFHDQGFKAFRWDDFFVRASGAIALTICFGLLGERKEITTLGLGEITAKKLR
jgi:hypothetical protein